MANPKSDEATSEERVRRDALEAKVDGLLTAGQGLEADVRELIHDVTALATLLGNHLGEPFRSKAAEIVTKRQTGNGRT